METFAIAIGAYGIFILLCLGLVLLRKFPKSILGDVGNGFDTSAEAMLIGMSLFFLPLILIASPFVWVVKKMAKPRSK